MDENIFIVCHKCQKVGLLIIARRLFLVTSIDAGKNKIVWATDREAISPEEGMILLHQLKTSGIPRYEGYVVELSEVGRTLHSNIYNQLTEAHRALLGKPHTYYQCTPA